jgi:hypothetical protein
MRVLSALGVSAEIKPLAEPPAVAEAVEHEMVPGVPVPELAVPDDEPDDDPELGVEPVGVGVGEPELVPELPPVAAVDDDDIQQAFVAP